MTDATNDPAQSLFHNYNLDHEPIGLLEAAMLLSDPRRQIAHDAIGDTEISTVFIVTDQSHGRAPLPLLYETMVFTANSNTTWCERYPTRDAAQAGHDRVCAWVRSPHTAPESLQQAIDSRD